jgi:hypothetical protein
MILIILTCFLTHFNALWGQFVSDDQAGLVTPFSWQNPQSIVRNIEFHFWGANPFPYHLTSLILHIFACMLLYKVMKIFFKPIPSLIGTLFFCVLPVHTEDVSWISGDGYIYIAIIVFTMMLLYKRGTE